MAVKVLIDRMKGVTEAIAAMRDKRVLVGIPQEKDERKPEPGEKAEALGNAAIGYIMETGAPEANIPARPWLYPGVKSNKARITARFEATARKALSGQPADVDQTLDRIGLETVTAVRKYMTDSGNFVPLAPATLAARKRRKVTRTKPLIDTGQLLGAVTYVKRDGRRKNA